MSSLLEPTSLLAANRTTKKMRRNHRSLSFKPLRRIGRMKASKKQLTLRRIPLCDSDEEGGRSDRRRKFIGEQRRRDCMSTAFLIVQYWEGGAPTGQRVAQGGDEGQCPLVGNTLFDHMYEREGGGRNKRVEPPLEGTCGSRRVDSPGRIHGDLLVEKASMKLRNLWPDDESTSLSITIGQALLRSVNVYPHSRLPIGLLNHDHVGNSINLEEKKRSSLADGLLAKIEALALRKLAMFEWDPLFSP
ncbi:hypothetical protein Tco_1002109 [Tanacetum coccineum]|uniref:Uncharacterized protein n=1 Tax=Tanacetum coccineum TaxID=301880 RepID=A0ABQ5F5E9_9ASTR